MNSEQILEQVALALNTEQFPPELRRLEALKVIARVLMEAAPAAAEVAKLRAEVHTQTAMIEGARRSASKFMLREEQFLKALDRIRGRDADHGYKDAFEMCKLIAGETVEAYHKGKI